MYVQHRGPLEWCLLFLRTLNNCETLSWPSSISWLVHCRKIPPKCKTGHMYAFKCDHPDEQTLKVDTGTLVGLSTCRLAALDLFPFCHFFLISPFLPTDLDLCFSMKPSTLCNFWLHLQLPTCHNHLTPISFTYVSVLKLPVGGLTGSHVGGPGFQYFFLSLDTSAESLP